MLKTATRHGATRGRVVTPVRKAHRDGAADLGELFRELRAWDALSAESMRAHGF